MMNQRTFRQLVLLVHQYTGFIFAAYLIVVCVTGAILVLLENQITDYRDYPMLRVHVQREKVPLTQMVRSVEQANRGRHVFQILESCTEGCTYDLAMYDSPDRELNHLDALVNPYTGRILRTAPFERSPVGLLSNLHGYLFLGETGKYVNAIAALSLILIGLTGLYLWPGWPALKRGFTIRWRGGAYRTTYDIHKVIGIAALLFLLMWAVTGSSLVLWPEPPENIAAVHQPPDAQPRNLDALVRAGNPALPGQLIYIYTAHNGSVVLRKRVPGDLDPYGDSYVGVNEYTGKVTQVYNIQRFPLIWRINLAMFPIHFGSPGGIVLRLIYVVMGVMPPVLFVTAFLMWLFKLKRVESRRTSRESTIRLG